MTDVKLKALRKHPFGTGEREAGEEYSATASEAKTLVALGWAEAVKEKEAKAEKEATKAATYKTRALKAGK